MREYCDQLVGALFGGLPKFQKVLQILKPNGQFLEKLRDLLGQLSSGMSFLSPNFLHRGVPELSYRISLNTATIIAQDALPRTPSNTTSSSNLIDVPQHTELVGGQYMVDPVKQFVNFVMVLSDELQLIFGMGTSDKSLYQVVL